MALKLDKHQRKAMRKSAAAHLDMIATLTLRASLADDMGFPDIAAGAREDINRRAIEVQQLRMRLEEEI